MNELNYKAENWLQIEVGFLIEKKSVINYLIFVLWNQKQL